MAKAKSIAEQIQDLQAENERLKKYDKIINMLCELEFGMSRKEVHLLLDTAKNTSDRNGKNVASAEPSKKDDLD